MSKIKCLSIFLALFFSTTTGMSFAKQYKCGCIDSGPLKSDDSKINGKTFKEVFENDPTVEKKFGKVECVKSELFKQPGQSSVSIREKNVKIYLEGKFQYRTDKQKRSNNMEIRFRPRNGQCIQAIGDLYKGKLWKGAWCDRDSYKKQSGFTLKDNPGSKPLTNAHTAFAVDVTGPNRYNAAVHWQWSNDNEMWLMTAVCLESK